MQGIRRQKNKQRQADHSLKNWPHVIRGKTQTGVFYGMKLAYNKCSNRVMANIVDVAFLGGIKRRLENNLSYSASKFAVVGMTKSWALEYGRKKIRINAACAPDFPIRLVRKLLAASPGYGR